MTGWVSIHREQWPEALPEMRPMFESHFNEVMTNRDLIKVKPDYVRYQALHDADLLHLVTMRAGGAMVGYLLSLIMADLHCSDCITAYPDALYVKPEFRDGWDIKRMLSFHETSCRARGVQRMLLGVKLAHDFGKVLEGMGYEPIERMYDKVFRD